MVAPSTAPDVLAHFMQQAILHARLIGSLTEDTARWRRTSLLSRARRNRQPGLGEPGSLYAYRLMDLIHNCPNRMFADTAFLQTWPDGRPLTGPEDALIEIARLLPHQWGLSTQDDLLLDWADQALAGQGLSVQALYLWAAPLIHGSRDYTNRPR